MNHGGSTRIGGTGSTAVRATVHRVPYTGSVTAGGPPDARELPDLTITKVSIEPMDNNAYLLRSRAGGEQVRIDAANDAETLLGLLHLSSRRRLWVVWGGVFGEFWVDSGGPAAYLVAVRAERGEFVGAGVRDPAVCAPGFLPSVEESSLSPGVDGAGGDAELGGQLGEEPFVLAGCLAGVRGLGGAAVGDGVPAAAQDLFDQSPADRSVAAVG